MTVTRLIRIAEQRKRSLLQKDSADSELSQELAFHLEQLTWENMAEGMDRASALAAARRALGNAGLIEEECRDQRRLSWIHDFAQDVRYGLRVLRAKPSLTAAVVLSLAMGIGGNTAILGVMDSIAGGSIAFHDPDRLVILRTFPRTAPERTTNAPLADYLVWKKTTRSFASMGASLASELDFDADENGAPAEHLSGQAFTADLFPTLGAAPLLGRFFTEQESQLANPPSVIVISYSLWQKRFAGDPGILARSVRLHGRPARIIGVMPPDFHYVIDTANFWVPLRFNREWPPDTARFYIAAARLRPGASIEQAQAEMDAIAASGNSADKAWGVRLQPVREALFGWTTQSLYTMEAGSLLLLLMVSANVSLLLLARASARGPEMALRAALGAGPWRIARQLLAESLLLSLSGGAVGMLFAWLGLHTAPTFRPPPGGTHLAAIPLNPRIFLIALLTSIAAAILFGGMPAVFGPEASGAASRKARSARLRSVLVIAEVAVALVLMSGAGLIVRSTVLLATREFHFNPHGLVTFEYRLSPLEYLRQQNGMGILTDPAPAVRIERVLERLRYLPGVSGVAGISYRPVNSLVLPTLVVRSGGSTSVCATVVYSLVTPGYFRVIEGRLLRGREIDEHDTSDHPWVAVVNETMARRFWPGMDPVGKWFVVDQLTDGRPREVVGVIRDIPTRSGQLDQDPVVYTSYLQQPSRFQGSLGNMVGHMTFVLRGSRLTPGNDPRGLMRAARRAAAEVDPAHPIANVATVEQQIGGRMRELETYMFTLASLAVIGTLLAVMGVYGMTAFAAAQRTREIAIRISLGASAWKVFALLGRWGILLATLGVTAGLAGALATTRLLSSQLWGVTATDPKVLAGATVLLAFVTLLACVLPARRAARVDPATVLRAE